MTTIAQPAVKPATQSETGTAYLTYFLVGAAFGFLLYKGEVISWYRIVEMFRFESFHMYGVIGSAVAVGAVSLQLMKRFGAQSRDGKPLAYPKKEFHWGVPIGGVVFGLGWALVGACPGPIFVHLGAGSMSFLLVFFSAVFGTWTYAHLRPRLPH